MYNNIIFTACVCWGYAINCTATLLQCGNNANCVVTILLQKIPKEVFMFYLHVLFANCACIIKDRLAFVIMLNQNL